MRKHKIFCFLVGLCLSLCFLSQFNLLCENTRANAISLPSDGHYMTASETLQFIGSEFPVEYYSQSGVVQTSAHYDSSYSSSVIEFSESPLGFVSNSGVTWLRYSFSSSSVSTVPTEITVKLQPTYSIFDTEYIYTCIALSAGGSTSGVPSASTYSPPTSNWYIAGSVNNFRNNSLSSANSGVYSFLSFGWGFYFTYIPVVASSQSAFSAYCIDANFYGNSSTNTGVYYLYIMCPYVSGNASGGSGTFAPGSDSGNINVNVDIDMSETNSLLGDILEGVAPIADLVDLLTDDVDIPAAGTVVNMPYDNEDYDNMIMTADAILDDIPDTVAAASFWVEITNAFFPENSWLRVIMPLLMIMALMAWLLWKK